MATNSTDEVARARAVRGFTLLEIGIALVLLGLMIAVAVPSLNSLTGARLKESTNLIGGAIRDTYARTALLGRSTRLVMDLEQQAWWIEESEGVARVKSVKLSADRDGKVDLDPKDRRIEDIEEDTTDVKEQAKVQLLSGPAFKAVDGDFGAPQKLPTDVRFKNIWIEHLDDKVTHGVTALYFYPGGFTEEALTLVVQPLTGEVYVERDEPRVPSSNEDDG